MSLKSDKTISGNTAKEFLENLINFFHANTPELIRLESASPGDSDYTGYPIYSAGVPGAVAGPQYSCGSNLNDFKSPVYFFGTSVDNVVLMITLMGKWLSFSMCHSLTAARKIGDIIDKANLTKICPLTNIVRGITDKGSGFNGQGLQYYTYKVHLDHSTDIYRISLQYINSDYSTCYRFRPLLASSSTPATYYDGEEQFSVIFTRTDKGVADRAAVFIRRGSCCISVLMNRLRFPKDFTVKQIPGRAQTILQTKTDICRSGRNFTPGFRGENGIHISFISESD